LPPSEKPFRVVKSPPLEAKSMTSANVVPLVGVKPFNRVTLMVPARPAVPLTASWSKLVGPLIATLKLPPLVCV